MQIVVDCIAAVVVAAIVVVVLDCPMVKVVDAVQPIN
jgi:hypothetical protein